jgi:hypothetical protein
VSVKFVLNGRVKDNKMLSRLILIHFCKDWMMRMFAAYNSALYHRIVHVLVYESDRIMFIQKITLHDFMLILNEQIFN